MLFGRHKTTMIDKGDALPGRADRPYAVGNTHAVLGTRIEGPYPAGLEIAYFGLGCFWGAEKAFWQLPGVYSTAAGYTGGFTENPTYEEVCSARTGHTEAVQVVYDPAKISYEQLLKAFWEGHDPSQENRQGNDIGTQYRSAIYWTTEEQHQQALAAKEMFQPNLTAAGYGEIMTELAPAGTFYFAESYHQQYLHKVPNGYCPSHGTGVSCPIGVARA